MNSRISKYLDILQIRINTLAGSHYERTEYQRINQDL